MAPPQTSNIHLPYTLQTWVGMVQNNGLPEQRYHVSPAPIHKIPTALKPAITAVLPVVGRVGTKRSTLVRPKTTEATSGWSVDSFSDFGRVEWSSAEHAPISELAALSVRTQRPVARELVRGRNEDVTRYLANIDSCCRPDVDVYRLTTLIKSRTRMDLEQAAGVVVSAFANVGRVDDAEALLRELTGVLAVSNMSVGNWEELTVRNTLANATMEAFANLAEKVYMWCEKAGADPKKIGKRPPKNYRSLVGLLVKVRRVRPRERCLYIPKWMFDEAGMEPPKHHQEYLDGYQADLESKGQAQQGILGYEFPTSDPEPGSVIVSKHGFRVIQTRIFRLFAFWDLGVRLRHQIRNLEDTILHAKTWMDNKLRITEDVAEICFWFFAMQRRMQLRIVSDEKWTTFLAKGEGEAVYQNNYNMRSTFESTLRRIAGKTDDETLGSEDETTDLIDSTCGLMKSYVDVYGKGDKESLVFKKGVRGGSGRGPVDEYNILCDILAELKMRAKNEKIEKVPGPVYKFLAKDIMAWNRSWSDDAFAGGKVHGWETWLKEKQEEEAKRMGGLKLVGDY